MKNANRLKHHLLQTLKPGYWLFIAILLFSALLQPNSVRAQAAEIPLEDYWKLVAETRSTVEGVSSLPPAEQAQTLGELADRWEAVERVKLPDGTVVQLDHRHLVSELRLGNGDPSALVERLTSLEIVRAEWAASRFSAAEAAEAVATLNTILSEPAFQWNEEELRLPWWLPFLERLSELFPSRLATPIALVMAAIVLLGVLLYVARALLGSFSPASNIVDDPLIEDGLTATAALEQAQTFSRGGDYRTAVRYLYLSTLLLLDERNLLRYDRTQTNREYLKSIAHRPEFAATLRDVIEVFDRVWYGYQPLDQAAYIGYEARVRELQHQR